MELLKGETWGLHDDVIECRFEGCRSDLSDVILNLIERITDRQLGSNLCNRKTGRLRCKGAGTRNTGVHLNHNDATRIWIDCKLNIATTSINADLADNRDGEIAKLLIFDICQSESGSDGNGITGMYTHRVDIFDTADNYDVIYLVAHNFKFILFPSNDGFLDQNLRSGAMS